MRDAHLLIIAIYETVSTHRVSNVSSWCDEGTDHEISNWGIVVFNDLRRPAMNLPH
jgi:hypothetical protein